MNAGINWETLVTILALLAAVAGLLKYVFYLLDKHKEHVSEKLTDHAKRLDTHELDIRAHGERLETTKAELHKRVTNTREEMHRDFARNEHLDRKLDEHGKVLGNIYTRMNDMAGDLNQVIGALNGKVKGKHDGD
ncbi:hypothetical protein [Sulfuriflexus mobilis]|uniref:hypothetical protein n=1 Tax=Sulfuriflexus mobilis TaxID=1811807 RepID=UPI000F8490D6|nr:hypothetical protein [Sulfuriflexus mobilis]